MKHTVYPIETATLVPVEATIVRPAGAAVALPAEAATLPAPIKKATEPLLWELIARLFEALRRRP